MSMVVELNRDEYMISEYAFTKVDVIKVYSGRRNTCMCGCKGNWSYSSTKSDKLESYNAINDRNVSRIYNKIMKDPNFKFYCHDGVMYIMIEENNRVYYAYFDC